MTAATRAHSGGLGWLALLAIGALVAVTISVPDVGEVTLGEHAVTRHGQEAWTVREAVQTGGPGGHWRCKDGKEYVIRHLGGEDWAVMVVRGGHEITAFVIHDRGYLRKILEEDGCSNGWSHP